MTLLVVALVWVVLFAVVMLAISVGLRYLETERKRRVVNLLSSVEDGAAPSAQTTILTGSEAQTETLMETISRLPVVVRLQARIDQAGLEWSALGVIAGMLFFAIIGAFLGSVVPIPAVRAFMAVGMGALFAMIPVAYVGMKRAKRMSQFEEQFPEALDFLARSMRAGHGFSVALEMLSAESVDPLGTEFRRVFNEQNLGSPIETALRNLTQRMPLLDVRFFVSAVLLQRETGGNLAEILTKLGSVIRERFRLKGQVKAVSAHGRLTAGILSVLPVVTLLGLMFVAPGYMQSMAEDPDGKYLILGSIIGQGLGYYTMRRIINIKV